MKPGSKVGCSKDDSIVFANSKTGEKTNEQSRPKESPSTTSSASNVSLAQLKLQRRKSFHNATLDKELQTPVTRVFLYIQMQLCRDLTLRHWLESNSARDYMLMLDWFDQIVAAVEYVHNEGMIHRDLKVRYVLFFRKIRC